MTVVMKRSMEQNPAAVHRMDQADISRIEKGAKAISLDVLDRLCKALKCEPGDILVRTRR